MLSGVILRKTKALSQNDTLWPTAVLFSGRAGVFFISFISQPILARLYTPAQFGEFAFLNSLLALLLIGSSGRYESGIILTNKPQKAVGIFQLAQIILICYALCLSLLTFISPYFLQNYLIEQGLNPAYLWVIPLIVFFSGYWQIVHNWLIRFEKFSQVSFALVSQRLLMFATAVISFYLAVPGNGLILSLFTGSLGIFITSLFIKRQTINVRTKIILQYAHHFRDFPLYAIPTQFLNLLMVHFPVLWITFFYDSANAGIFSMAFTLASVPLNLLHVSLGQIFYQRLAQCKANVQIPFTTKYCKKYAAVLIPVVLVAIIFGKQLTQFFLGKSWIETGTMISLLSILMLIQGIDRLFMYIITVNRKEHFNLILQAVQLFFWALAFSIGLYLSDILISLGLIILFSIIQLLFTFLVVSRYIIPPKSLPLKKVINQD